MIRQLFTYVGAVEMWMLPWLAVILVIAVIFDPKVRARIERQARRWQRKMGKE